MKDEKKDEKTTNILTKLLEAAIIFVVSAFLIRLGVSYILCVWPVLVIIATVVLGGVIAYRIWKRKHDSNW